MRSALFVALALTACSGEDRTPEGAARLFLRAVEEGNATEVYRLLAPSTQEALGKLLQLAGAQAGGGRRFKPEELLAVGQEPGHGEVSEVLVASINGDRARVRLISAKKKVEDSVELVRVGAVWRVLLPPGVTAPVATPASAPASRPASAPSTAPASAPLRRP
jgi:hypothetical protein